MTERGVNQPNGHNKAYVYCHTVPYIIMVGVKFKFVIAPVSCNIHLLKGNTLLYTPDHKITYSTELCHTTQWKRGISQIRINICDYGEKNYKKHEIEGTLAWTSEVKRWKQDERLFSHCQVWMNMLWTKVKKGEKSDVIWGEKNDKLIS